MKTALPIFFASIILFGALATAPLDAQILTSVTSLTGGDAGEGFSPLAIGIDDYNIVGNSVTIQGLTFTTGSVTLENGASGGAFTASSTITATSLGFGSTANDNAMLSLLQGFEFVGGGTVYNFTPTGKFAQIQFTGLTLGQTYQLDIFTVADSGNRDTNFAVTGSQSEDNTILTTTTAQDVEYTLTPDSLGDITLDYGYGGGGTGTANAGLVSGVSLTTAAPEPGTSQLILVSLVLAVAFGFRRLIPSR